MKISLNGKTAHIDKRGCRHMGHLLEKIQKEFLAQTDVMVKIVANDEDISATDESQWPNIPSPPITRLAVETAPIKTLSLQSIQDVRESLEKVQSVLGEVVADVGRKDRTDRAVSHFHDVIKLFDQWVFPIVERLCTLYKLPMDTFTVNGQSAVVSINLFIKGIEEAVTHLERSAFEDFRTHLTEEVTPRITDIDEVFQQIHQYIQTHGK